MDAIFYEELIINLKLKPREKNKKQTKKETKNRKLFDSKCEVIKSLAENVKRYHWRELLQLQFL